MQTNEVWKNEESICHDKGWGKIGEKIYGIKKVIKKRRRNATQTSKARKTAVRTQTSETRKNKYYCSLCK